MEQRRGWALAAAGAAAGAGAGYLLERALLRSRLQQPSPVGPELGSIAGETVRLLGPEGLSLLVERHGPVDAPQVVLAHAWVCTARVWHEQVAALSERARLIAYDQPGHGRTSSPRSGRYDLDLFGDTLAAVIEQATEPGPLVLCGHSLGGMTILNMMRRHPALTRERVASVVLLSTASAAAAEGAAEGVRFGFGIHSVARFERWVRRGVSLVRPEARYLVERLYRASTDLSFLLTRAFGLSRHAEPRHVDFTEQLLLDSDFEMITGVLAPILTLDEDESLEGITVPTTVICGSDDKLTPIALSRRMVERCGPAELLELPGVGHMTPLEAADTVNAVLADRLRRVAEEVA